MGMLLLGLIAGVVGISIPWLIFIAYFDFESDSLAIRIREWVRSKLPRRG